MTQPKDRRRIQQVLTWIFIGILGWRILYPVWSGPLLQKREALEIESKTNEDLRSRISEGMIYLQKIRTVGRICLPSDPYRSAIKYQEWLQNACQSAGVVDAMVSVRDPVPLEGVGARIEATLKAEVDADTAYGLIDLLSTSEIAHRIVNIKLRQGKPANHRLSLEIDLDALSLKDNPARDGELQGPSLNPRPLSRTLAEQRHFSRYEPPSPSLPEVVQEEPESVEPKVEVIPPPKSDLLDSIRLVGITERDGKPRAIFQNRANGKDSVVEEQHDFQFEHFVARVERIDREFVLLKQGNAKIEVQLGQSLKESLKSEPWDFR